MTIDILQKEHPVLRETAKDVPLNLFGTEELKKIIKKMIDGLHQEADAVAIAAPQIGVSLNIFVVLGSVFLSNSREAKKDKQEVETEKKEKKKNIKIANFEGDFVFINPLIVSTSKKMKEMDEGCLSVRLLYGKVKRCEKVKLEAFDFNGNKINYGASGLISQIFQHETDHLKGTLFIDKATNLVEITREELEKHQKNHAK